MADTGRKIIAQNKKARFNYSVEDTIECGIALEGTEVKSVKEGSVSFADSFALIEKGEVWMQNFHISPYAYCAGNPVLYGDPSGMKWNNLNDSLQMNIMLDARLLALKTSIHVLKRGRHESELSEAEAREISELQSQKQSVETSKQNLKDLGDDNKNFYELNYVTGDEIVAHNQLVNGIVQISTGHDLVLGVHEMDHIARYLGQRTLFR